DGAWHHVVGTQGPSGMALYVDGAQIGTNAVPNSQAYDGYWRVGADNLNGWPDQPSSGFFAGRIDETAVYPSVLTADQVSRHYALASAPAVTVAALTPDADTYVNQAAAGANYGADKSVAVRGSSA